MVALSAHRRKGLLQLSVVVGLFILSGLVFIHSDTVVTPLLSSSLPFSLKKAVTLTPNTPREAAQIAFKPTIDSNHAVAVFDHNGFHDEVHGAVLWTLKQFDGLDIRFYRGTWRYAFEETIAKFWTTLPKSPKTFIDDLNSDTSIRHVVMTTCDWDWYKVGDGIEQAWLARNDDEKFVVTCFRHWNSIHVVKDLGKMASWGAMSEVGLGDHVTKNLQGNAEWTADFLTKWPEAKPQSEGLLAMPIKTFIPVFPAETYPEEGDPMFDPRDDEDNSLNNAIIQSTTWDDAHRNLSGIYEDLRRHLKEDSVSWGYNPPTDTDEHWTPIPDHPNPFRLYLTGGSRAWLPEEFKWIVHYRVGYSYPHFYGALQSADIVLPAFGTTRYDGDRASSTMGVSGSAPVPLMTTKNYSDAYGYFCPAFGIIRPDGESEIDHIAAIRKGQVQWGTRGERREALRLCQQEWTEKNMLTMAELLRLV